ncbi:MAG: YaiO family outer membrane beta-barrel protein, partial [Verrucomicrobia bacterium]|nr:YaiO family outer membrane beta-barrel protein [Verrucomicrobiota bacterium]
RLATRAGRVSEGLQLYEQVTAANPESIEGWLGVARTAQMRGDKNRAWAALDQAFRVAPRSALVYDAMCRLAFETDNRERMQMASHGFLLDQPFDTRGEVWLQRWNAAHGYPADVARLNGLLDPLAPETTRTAMDLIRGQTKESPQQVMERLPATAGNVQLAAQETLENQAKIAQRENIRAGVSTGYEYSYIHDTTAAKAKLPDWHEAYIAAFWGQPKALTYSLDTRRYERFGELAWQINPGVAWEFTDGWVWRVESGIAAQGDIIPRWRTGMGLDWYQPKFTASLDLAYLNFSDANVWLLIPGITWQWSDQWNSSVKVYVARNQLRGKRTDYTAAVAFGAGWQFTPLSSVGAIYSVGGENAAEPLKGLIGEGLFQSVALNFKWGITEHWTLEPLYRFESHPNFDAHVTGLNLHWRY